MTSKFEKIKYLLYNMKWDLLCLWNNYDIPKKNIINKKNNFICSLYQVENFLNKFTILLKTKNFAEFIKKQN